MLERILGFGIERNEVEERLLVGLLSHGDTIRYGDGMIRSKVRILGGIRTAKVQRMKGWVRAPTLTSWQPLHIYMVPITEQGFGIFDSVHMVKAETSKRAADRRRASDQLQYQKKKKKKAVVGWCRLVGGHWRRLGCR